MQSSNREKKPRSVRVEERLWERFGEACDANYTNRTEKLNEFMHAYVNKWEMRGGYLDEETEEQLAEEISKLVKKQSMLVLQDIMGELAKGAINDDEVERVLNSDTDTLRDQFT